jgi:hypothetical protein
MAWHDQGRRLGTDSPAGPRSPTWRAVASPAARWPAEELMTAPFPVVPRGALLPHEWAGAMRNR